MLAALLINGLALGSAYALVALGLVLVLNATQVVNFAHGDLVVAGGVTGAAFASISGLPVFLILPLAACAAGLIGLLIGAAGYLPLRGRPASAVILATIAFGIVIQNGLLLTFGPAPRTTPPLMGGGSWAFWGFSIPRQDAVIIVVATVLIATVYMFLHHSWTGKRLRAVSQDADMARACGIPTVKYALATFVLGAALAGAAGVLLANRFFLAPGDGAALILKAYVAAMIGGWGSLGGTVAGALLIALFEVLVSTYVSQTAALVLLYALLLVLLAVRPQGLFGEAARFRA